MLDETFNHQRVVATIFVIERKNDNYFSNRSVVYKQWLRPLLTRLISKLTISGSP